MGHFTRKELIKSLLKHPSGIIPLFMAHTARLWPDELFLKIKFYHYLGYKLNLDHPRTFNEKLQWLKLHDRKPEYTQMVDKEEAKKYVARLIGEKYIIPTLGVYEKGEDIDFDMLPNQFVLKCTHDSGGIVICKDKRKLDLKATIKKLNHSLKKNYYYQNREWPYKNVKPRIIAEKYMEDEHGELRDYKWFCFDGEPKAMFIATDRFNSQEETKFDFYDMEFNHLPFTNGHPNALRPIQKPKDFDLMMQLAAKLSKDIPEVRIDFYDVNGHVYFGEITFFHWSGMTPFVPLKWDYIFGDWIKI